MRKSLLGAVAVAALMLPGAALAQSGTIKIGILVALEGAFATGGQDGVRNVELALKQVNNTIAGKKIETVVAPTDTKPDTTVRMARKLVEQDKVDFIIGPLSGSEGIAMRDFAKTIPDKVVINGISGALETTWVDPAANFYRFNLDGSQWGFGLGGYVVKAKGWKKVATHERLGVRERAVWRPVRAHEQRRAGYQQRARCAGDRRDLERAAGVQRLAGARDAGARDLERHDVAHAPGGRRVHHRRLHQQRPRPDRLPAPGHRGHVHPGHHRHLVGDRHPRHDLEWRPRGDAATPVMSGQAPAQVWALAGTAPRRLRVGRASPRSPGRWVAPPGTPQSHERRRRRSRPAVRSSWMGRDREVAVDDRVEVGAGGGVAGGCRPADPVVGDAARIEPLDELVLVDALAHAGDLDEVEIGSLAMGRHVDVEQLPG